MSGAAGPALPAELDLPFRPARAMIPTALAGVHATWSLLAEAARTRSAPQLSEVERVRCCAAETQRLATSLAKANGVRITVAGEVPRRTSLLVANHLGYWDAVVLGTLLPLAAIAKAELAHWPLLGRCGRALGMLHVRRGDAVDGARLLRLAGRRLAAGVHVLNFPEGTTTDGTRLLPFRRGLFGIAARAQVPVVPVALRLSPPDAAWLGGEAFLPHYWRHWRRGGRVDATVRFGSPLRPEDHVSAEACAAEARACVATLLGREA